MGRKIGALILAVFVFGLDRWLQVLVASHMVLGQSIPVLPPVLWITYITNTGAAFSLFRRGGDPVFIVIALAILVALAIFIIRQPRLSTRLSVGAGLLAGGTAGNLWDRLVSGRVVDYIHFRFWAIFNLADAAIVVGIILIVWEFWRKDQERAGYDA
ncbi:signal peptidase II [Sulfobacillus harzensis]|uniref:Lipoprotein signal peptidase n=1 Tax=Sulfobacillus harzensis TaxID=2729629 RepID=A0A7Y0L1M2_9FIRM|nr:signal peptidase II [Sulfobacillus harzensis]NMP21636.1 signal peptidase II [Sulfobacillus harzensis]